MGKRAALLIGTSRYLDETLRCLSAPIADVEGVARVLRDKQIGDFDEVTVLIDKSWSIVQTAVADFYHDRLPDDMLLFYFSGHGVRDITGRLYLAMHDTKQQRLAGTAVSSTFVRDEMDRSTSRRQIVILDCCHSGAFAADGMGAESGAGSISAFAGGGYGRAVLTATDAIQQAHEGPQEASVPKPSVFTRHLLAGLSTGAADTDNDGEITLDELYDYVYQHVRAEAPDQRPHKSATRIEGELLIARNPQVKPGRLPAEVLEAANHPLPSVRQAAVADLTKLAHSASKAIALSAREEMERLAHDDSRQVSSTAVEALRRLDQKGAPDEPPAPHPRPPQTRRRWRYLLPLSTAILAAAGFVIAKYWLAPHAQPQTKRISIGVLALEKEADTTASEIMEGISKAAPDLHNWSGGADDVYKPDLQPFNSFDAALAAAKSNKIAVLIVAASPLYPVPIGQLASQSDIPIIASRLLPEDATGRGNVFELLASDEAQGREIARVAREILQRSRTAVLTESGSAYSERLGDAFVARFRFLGGTATQTSYDNLKLDFDERFKELLKDPPDAIYIPGAIDDVAKIIKWARAKQIDCIFLGSDSWDTGVTLPPLPERVKFPLASLVGRDIDGSCYTTLVCSYASRSDDPEHPLFVQFGQDIAQLTFNVIKEARSLDRASIVAAFRSRWAPGSNLPCITQIADGEPRVTEPGKLVQPTKHGRPQTPVDARESKAESRPSNSSQDAHTTTTFPAVPITSPKSGSIEDAQARLNQISSPNMASEIEKLRPNEADCRTAFEMDFAGKLKTRLDSIWNAAYSEPLPRRQPGGIITEPGDPILVNYQLSAGVLHRATADELQKWTGDTSAYFHPGFRQLARVLRSAVPLLAVAYSPQSSNAPTDAWIYVNGKWRIFRDPWLIPVTSASSPTFHCHFDLLVGWEPKSKFVTGQLSTVYTNSPRVPRAYAPYWQTTAAMPCLWVLDEPHPSKDPSDLPRSFAAFERFAKGENATFSDTADLGKLLLSADRQCVMNRRAGWLLTSSGASDPPRRRTICVRFFGIEGIVALQAFDTQEDFPALASSFAAMIARFKFDDKFTYQPPP